MELATAVATQIGVKHYGKVKWFEASKGYGFIIPEDGSEDVFVHYTGIAAKGYRSLQEGARVSYNIVKGNNEKKKWQAVNVEVVDPA